jgi:curli biogenesis system outer membrane secretion channel CsgG
MIDTFYDNCNVSNFGTEGVKYSMELRNTTISDIYVTKFEFTRQFTTFVRQNLSLCDSLRHLRDKI